MKTLDLTRQGLVRALSAGMAGSAPIEAALRARAGEIARRAAPEDAEAVPGTVEPPADRAGMPAAER